jgi:electron transfer flavoprotein alpha subunit
LTPGTLVLVEHHDGEPTKGSLGVLTQAASLGGDVAAVVVGSGVRDLATGLGAYGASKVYVADDEKLSAPLPQPRVDVLARLLSEHEHENVFFASSVLTADVAAALSARIDAGLNWDLTGIEVAGDRLVGKRPALGDTVVVEAGWTSPPRLALFRTGAFEPGEANGGQPELVDVATDVEEWSTQTRMVEQAHEEKSGPSIEDADIVVAGGRGLGEAGKFSLLEDLAKALGGAVAATRAVVDAGWYPYATQVGQTGRVVSPKLYLACGISGAIQHKVGMQSSGTIVAINKDPNAPIFEYSDLAVVGDLHEIVPKLTELVRERKGG